MHCRVLRLGFKVYTCSALLVRFMLQAREGLSDINPQLSTNQCQQRSVISVLCLTNPSSNACCSGTSDKPSDKYYKAAKIADALTKVWCVGVGEVLLQCACVCDVVLLLQLRDKCLKRGACVCSAVSAMAVVLCATSQPRLNKISLVSGCKKWPLSPSSLPPSPHKTGHPLHC